MCSDSRGIEWLFEKRGSESFGLISKSWKRLWWVSKSHVRVILRLLKSRSWKPRSRSLAKSWIYHSIPLIVVCELESGKKLRRMRGRLERGLFLRCRPMPKPLAVFSACLHLSAPRSHNLDALKKSRDFFPRDFFTLTPNREPVHRLPGKRKWTLNRIWVVRYFSFKLIEWLAGWPWEAKASVPPISRCWSRELAFARRKKRGRL